MPVPADRHAPTFRLVIVPGVTAGKWSDMWSERLPDVELCLVHTEVAFQTAALMEAQADAGLVRLPVDRETLDAIPLYTEATVVVGGRDSVITAADDVTCADLADERLLIPLDDVLALTDAPETTAANHAANHAADRPATTAAAIELVAAGVGLLVVPQSLARLHHRRDLTYRVITDAPMSTVALTWVRDRHTNLIEEMIGIVRGRTANSTRGRSQPSETPPPARRGTPESRPAQRSPRRRRGR